MCEEGEDNDDEDDEGEAKEDEDVDDEDDDDDERTHQIVQSAFMRETRTKTNKNAVFTFYLY